MCMKISSLLPLKGYMLNESLFLVYVLASIAHKGDCFEEIVVEPLPAIKGDSEFISPLQNLEEIILEMNSLKRKCCLR